MICRYSKDTWKILDDARQHYMTIVEELNDMNQDDQLTWLSITEAIEEEIKKTKSKVETITKPKEHKRRLAKELRGWSSSKLSAAIHYKIFSGGSQDFLGAAYFVTVGSYHSSNFKLF